MAEFQFHHFNDPSLPYLRMWRSRFSPDWDKREPKKPLTLREVQADNERCQQEANELRERGRITCQRFAAGELSQADYQRESHENMVAMEFMVRVSEQLLREVEQICAAVETRAGAAAPA